MERWRWRGGDVRVKGGWLMEKQDCDSMKCGWVKRYWWKGSTGDGNTGLCMGGRWEGGAVEVKSGCVMEKQDCYKGKVRWVEV